MNVERVRRKLIKYGSKFDLPVECIIEALEIFLNRNCSTYCGQFWLQENGTAIGPKNACLHADIVTEEIDNLESQIVYQELKCWFRFRDDTFVLWRCTAEKLQAFFRDRP